MKNNIIIYYIVTLIISSLGSSCLYFFAESNLSSLFYPTLIILGIVLGTIFSDTIESTEEKLITNKYKFVMFTIIGLVAIIILLTISFKGFTIQKWSAGFGNQHIHIHGRHTGFIYLILNITKTIEPLWWGVIFGIYALYLVPSTTKRMFLFTHSIAIKKPTKNESFKSDISFKKKDGKQEKKITAENINQIFYNFIKNQIDNGNTKTLIPYFEKTSVELDKNCVIENYYFDSVQQSKDVLNEYEGDIVQKTFIKSKLLSTQSLQELGESFRKYFYENMENNESLQKSFLKGLQMHYIVRTETLSETNPIVITDVIISKKDIKK